MTGEVLGHYRITGKLGEGGMGVVYRAHDTRLGRDVALKVLPPALAGNPDRLQRFEREARTLASFNHPNIAAIHGMEQGALVMELVEGETLDERLRTGPLPLDEARGFARQIADALEAAHERGIIHRDLKPANVKITPEGQVKLLDFGLAKALQAEPQGGDPNDSPTVTIGASLPGTIMGTAAYMSPEQARGGRVDHRTDIWAFGVVLFEMTTGRRLFTGATVSDVLAAVLRADPEIQSAPAAVRPLLARCLERDVRQRLGWIGEARRLLEASPAPVVTTPVPTRRSALVWTAAGAAAAGSAATAILRPGPPAPPAFATRLVRLTNDGASYAPALSPDGKLVAFVAKGSTGFDLRVRPVAGGAGVRLASGVSNWRRPAFSPDGSKIYYVAAEGLFEVETIGGESRLIVPGLTGAVFLSPDGQWLANIDNLELRVRPFQGSEWQSAGSFRILPSLAWWPDGRKLICSDGLNGTMGKPRIVDLSGSAIRSTELDTRAVVSALEQLGLAVDLNASRIIAVLSNGDMVMSLRHGDAANWWRVNLQDAKVPPVPLTATVSGVFALADLRASRLVMEVSRKISTLWSLPADMNAGRVTGEPQRVTPAGLNAEFQRLHPDGIQLMYAAEKLGSSGLFVRNVKTGQDRVLYQGPEPAGHCIWSPDGRQVAFFIRKGDWPIYVMPAEGGSPRKLGDSGGRLRAWSPDGRFLLVWRVAAPANTAGVFEVATGKYTTILSSAQGILHSISLSPDGRWVAFGVRGATSRMFIAPFRGDQPVPESEWIAVAEGIGLLFFAPDSRAVYHAVANEIWRQPLDADGRPQGKPALFQRFDNSGLAMQLNFTNTPAVAPDRLIMMSQEGPSDLWMVDLPGVV